MKSKAQLVVDQLSKLWAPSPCKPAKTKNPKVNALIEQAYLAGYCEASDIVAACQFSKLSAAKTMHFLNERKSVDEVREMIVRKRSRNEQQHS